GISPFSNLLSINDYRGANRFCYRDCCLNRNYWNRVYSSSNRSDENGQWLRLLCFTCSSTIYLAANLMNSGKISEKLINLALAIVGPIRGGLAHANVLVSMMFAGVSGAAQADTAGVGKILIPSML